MEDPSALIEAIRSGDARRVGALLEERPSLATARPEQGITPLLLSTYMRDEAMVRLLLDHGAVPDLHEAAALGRNDLARRLLASGDALETHSADGWTALHLAAHFGHEATVLMLLEQGADVAAPSTNANRNTALHAAAAGGQVAAVKALLAAHADPDAPDAGGNTPLHIAAAGGNLPMIRALLAAGATRAVPNGEGKTAADIATERGHAAAARHLA